MAAIADSIRAADEVQIEWRQDPIDHHLACPACWGLEKVDRALKEHNGGGLICSHSLCRLVLAPEERERAIPSHTGIHGLLCPKCHRALKGHNGGGVICSNKFCRFRFRARKDGSMSTQVAPSGMVQQRNYKTIKVQDIAQDPYTFTGPYAEWDGSGDTEVLLMFPDPEQPPTGDQVFPVKFKKAGGPGGRLQSWQIELWQDSQGITVLDHDYNVDLPEEGVLVNATWNASQLLDPSGAKVQLKLRQVHDGAYGKPSERRSVVIGAAAWIQT